MKRTTFVITLFWLALAGMAQNAVDRLVEEFSSVGYAKYTSAIERNPDTRAVQKVVKTLRLDMPDNARLRSGFLQEARHHNTSETIAGQVTTVIFTDEQRSQARIYMLKYGDDYAEVTIIINYKNNKSK